MAKLAASCDYECEELHGLAELNVLKKSESLGLMKLAELAVKTSEEEKREKIRKRIDEYRLTADYKTLEEALESQ